MDLASAARAVNATNAASPGTEVKAKGEDEEAIVVAVVVAVAVWHFLRGLPSHRRLIHLEGEFKVQRSIVGKIHNSGGYVDGIGSFNILAEGWSSTCRRY